MNKKADLSIQILIVAVIAIIVMVVVIFIFTGRTRFFAQTISSCNQIGVCAGENGCDTDSSYPIPVMVEDKTCTRTRKYTDGELTYPEADPKDKLRLCCQRVGE